MPRRGSGARWFTALNVNLLARLTVSMAYVRQTAREVRDANRTELQDLESSFNDELVWRHHLAMLEYRGLGMEGPGAGRA